MLLCAVASSLQVDGVAPGMAGIARQAGSPVEHRLPARVPFAPLSGVSGFTTSPDADTSPLAGERKNLPGSESYFVCLLAYESLKPMLIAQVAHNKQLTMIRLSLPNDWHNKCFP